MTEDQARELADQVDQALVNAGLPSSRDAPYPPHIFVRSNGAGEVQLMISGTKQWPAHRLLNQARKTLDTMGLRADPWGDEPVDDLYAFMTLAPR